MNLHVPIGSVKIIYPSNKVKVEKLINTNTIACTGEDANSQHPKVYLSLKTGVNKCPYCGTFFRKQQ